MPPSNNDGQYVAGPGSTATVRCAFFGPGLDLYHARAQIVYALYLVHDEGYNLQAGVRGNGRKYVIDAGFVARLQICRGEPIVRAKQRIGI